MKPFTIFISYAIADRRVAGFLKMAFEDMGFEALLAHEDIRVSAKSLPRIRQSIKNAHLIVPLITRAFHKSFYTDQECGMALWANMAIAPVVIGKQRVPHGFMVVDQGQHYRKKGFNPRICAKDIISGVVQEQPGLKSLIMESMLVRSSDVHDNFVLGDTAQIWSVMGNITTKNAERIFDRVLSNPSFRTCILAAEPLRIIRRKARHALSAKMKRRLQAHFGSD